MDFSLVGLRVVRAVAERGTFTAAAQALGYTQSAVSRQVAAVEAVAGAPVFERRRDGVRPTAAGRVVLRHAGSVLDAVDACARELGVLPGAAATVRLGAFTSAGAVLVPRALTALRRTDPALTVTTRDGSTPALVRALRAGTLDLAVLGSTPPFRPPDDESPALVLETLAEHSLHVAVPASDPLARGDVVDVEDLADRRWIVSRSSADETLLGVWPGLAGRPEIAHTARDWLGKLSLVAAGCGLTSVPAVLAPAAPAGVRVLPVRGGPQERRRVVLARRPGEPTASERRVAVALRAAASEPARAALGQWDASR
jgi:DNA-binding transcriptional LysR family regulator